MKKVVFLGDFNIDLIMDGLEAAPVPDHEVGCESFDLAIGASSCITASAYASLGGSAWVGGLSGEDDFGRFMLGGLRSDGVRTEMVRIDPAEKTGLTVNLVRMGGRIQVTYPGSMARFALSDIPDALLDGMAHLHVSGLYQAKALLPGVSALLAKAAAAGATCSLDCQWDPSERWEYLDEWLPRVDWLFANADEARSMTRRADPSDALLALAARTRCPVMKNGAAGACVMADGRRLDLPALPVDVVDTIGAGDNFDAGFLYAVIEKGMAAAEAARMANAVAGRSCTFRGGTLARSTWQDVLSFMEAHT
jgi:sugar/nucleoside kinase (ribokinase family)